MSKFEVGSIVEGKVLKLKPFGAIVELDKSTQGLIHISQIANGFVENIKDHLKEGDIIKIKVISVDKETGKISLSLREAQPPSQNRKPYNSGNQRHSNSDNNHRSNNQNSSSNTTTDTTTSFEDKLKEWNKQSSERQAGINKRNNRR